MIGVIGWFARTAKVKGQGGFLWGFIGAISYYGPVLIFGRVLYPEIVKGSVTYDNQGSYMIVGILLNLTIGIGCCFLARKILLSIEGDNTSTAESNEGNGDDQWYYHVGESNRGPLSVTMLKELYKNGEVQDNTTVWTKAARAQFLKDSPVFPRLQENDEKYEN
jgi:hypothetical protein